jgi:hypothetical protein
MENERSKYWERMCEILEKNFPKGECKERGAALVFLAEIEYLLNNDKTPQIGENSPDKENGALGSENPPWGQI